MTTVQAPELGPAKQLQRELLAFNSRYPGTRDQDVDVPAGIWERWVTLAMGNTPTRGEGLNGRPEDDLGLRVAAEALASMRAAENDDGVDCAGNEVQP